MGEFCLLSLVELHQDGSAPSACIADLFPSTWTHPLKLLPHTSQNLWYWIVVAIDIYDKNVLQLFEVKQMKQEIILEVVSEFDSLQFVVRRVNNIGY